MKPQSETSLERPLSGGAKLFLTLRASFVVLAFYAFAFSAILFLTLWIGLEMAAGFVAGTFTRAVGVRRALRNHFGLLRAFLGSFRLDKSIEARVKLDPADAPELFTMIESACLRTQVPFPREVFVEMHLNAWVRLKGWRRGTGTVVLGLGYDLLAGLTAGELEAVLAHELTHARLTQRAVRDGLARGLERAVQLVRNLALAGRHRKAASSVLRQVFLAMSDALATSAAKWIAAVSRQEEFDADWGAAELCGAPMARATLIKVQSLSRFTARLPWRERVAQLQAHAFRPWLVKELSAVKSMDTLEIAAEIADRFSTHPLLRERLNALPASGTATESDERTAIDLIPEADALAETLMARIEQTFIEREERDSRALRRWARQMREATGIRPVQLVGASLVVAAEVAGVAAWIVGATVQAALVILITSILGLLLYWHGRWRDRFALPVPDFGLLKKAWPCSSAVTPEKIAEIEADFRQRVKTANKTASTTLAAKSVHALGECDYLKAGVTAKLCLEENPNSLQPALIAAIASAWLGHGEATTRALAVVQEQVGLRGESVCWGVAWTYMLRGNWARAEALLDQILDKQPDNPTLLNLRALCQSRRGKIQSAIISARRACHPQAVNREHAKFLIDLLLEGGYLREAQEWLRPLDKTIQYDQELMLTATRLDLLLHDFEVADHWAEALVSLAPPAYMIVRLAAIYELARRFDEATRFYRSALEEAFYPDACLGLARLEAERNNFPAAQQHALNALNLRQALGQYATPPLELLGPILNQLAALEPPSRFCHAWTATLAANSLLSLVPERFVVYAPNQNQAQHYLNIVLAAMSGSGSRLLAVSIAWQLSPPEHQPFGMASPGVQALSDGRDAIFFRAFRRRGPWAPHYTQVHSSVDVIQPLSECA
ncbi:MAG TPA: M48 family metalloprotease [Verrucomicrobiae bacterium]|nr:M48 family metalloprotease [Verrucomicrobiae bacterium]